MIAALDGGSGNALPDRAVGRASGWDVAFVPGNAVGATDNTATRVAVGAVLGAGVRVAVGAADGRGAFEAALSARGVEVFSGVVLRVGKARGFGVIVLWSAGVKVGSVVAGAIAIDVDLVAGALFVPPKK